MVALKGRIVLELFECLGDVTIDNEAQ